MRRTSKHLHHSYSSIDTNFDNLGFETIDDSYWDDGDYFYLAGAGIPDCFENFSQLPDGPYVDCEPANKMVALGGTVSVGEFDNYRKSVSVTGDTGVDSIFIARIDADDPVPAPDSNTTIYEALLATSDVSGQMLFVPHESGGNSYIIIAILSGAWQVFQSGTFAPAADIPAPENDTVYHVKITLDWTTGDYTLYVGDVNGDGTTSSTVGETYGVSPPASIDSVQILTGYTALGIPTPSEYTCYLIAYDCSQVQGYVENRILGEQDVSEGNNAACMNFTIYTNPYGGGEMSIAQAGDILADRSRVLVDIHVDDLAIDNAVQDAQLLPNYDFNVNIDEWQAGGIPEYGDYVGSISRDTTDPQEGAGALRLTGGTNNKAVATSSINDVDGGKSYRFTGYTKGITANSVIGILASYYTDGVRIGGVDILARFNDPDSYTEFSVDVYPPKNANGVRLHVAMKKRGSGETTRVINIDTLSFKEINYPHLFVSDNGNTYYNTPIYDGAGWYVAELEWPKENDSNTIGVAACCGYGRVVIDNFRFQ